MLRASPWPNPLGPIVGLALWALLGPFDLNYLYLGRLWVLLEPLALQ